VHTPYIDNNTGSDIMKRQQLTALRRVTNDVQRQYEGLSGNFSFSLTAVNDCYVLSISNVNDLRWYEKTRMATVLIGPRGGVTVSHAMGFEGHSFTSR